MKFYISGKDTRIEILVMGREYPNTTDYWDSNWLTSKVMIEIPGYTARFISNLRTDELGEFLHALKNINQKLSGKAILDNLESYIHLEGEIDTLGCIHWSAETCYPAGIGAVLQFEFESDQSYLEKLIKELENVLRVYPVIGKP